MAWSTLKTTTLIMSAMIGQAVAVEYLRSLPPDARAAAAERIRKALLASVQEYSAGKVTSSDPKDLIGHQMMVSEMERGAEPALKELVDLASAE